MSKAFTRESDDLPDRRDPLRQLTLLPPGTKNYLTADGARRFREELDRLVQVERPQAAPVSDSEDRKHQLEILNQWIDRLERCLQSAEIVPPPAADETRIRFGATVTVRDHLGVDSNYRIVGVDETDLNRGWISWLSPLAKALRNKRVGQKVRFAAPSGEEELEITNVAYESSGQPQ